MKPIDIVHSLIIKTDEPMAAILAGCLPDVNQWLLYDHETQTQVLWVKVP